MSRASCGTVLMLALCLIVSCVSAPDPLAQSLVESIASRNKDIVRLSVHAIPDGGTEYMAVASTSSEKLGKPSDPEDLQAVETGEIIVLDEPGGIDVTVPILRFEGEATAAAGVTVNADLGRDAAIQLAQEVAVQIEQGMINGGMNQ